MTRILLLGRDGQVGWELQRSLAPLGGVIALGHAEANFEKPDTLRAVIHGEAPDLIVNAAAYNAVDKAETDSERAMAVNCHAVGVLAEEAKKLGAILIHYSTDYVFDGGKSEPYTEEDTPNPINFYGRTKVAGERAIHAAGCRHLIFRTSWVYAVRGTNFAKTILRLASERVEIGIIADQFGAPTSAELIADVTAQCVSLLTHCSERFGRLDGIYHLVAAGETSWHGYARFVVAEATKLGLPLRLVPDAIRAISTGEYPLPAKRPANSRLATAKLCRALHIRMPHWQAHLKRFLAEFVASTRS